MIRVNINESFPLTALLIDEEADTTAAEAVTGLDVYYDVRRVPGDVQLSPPIEGVLEESAVEKGVYTSLVTVSDPGTYIAYVTCSGFQSSTENIQVNKENIYDLVRKDHHYNISVEDVLRTEKIPTKSQDIRNVPRGKTDYVLTRIKNDDDKDWKGPDVAIGKVYAWYRDKNSKVPYKMADDGLGT